jgi:hypothetical protein
LMNDKQGHLGHFAGFLSSQMFSASLLILRAHNIPSRQFRER